MTTGPACPHCRAAPVETRQTAPYIGPGPRLVTLCDVPASVCPICNHFELHIFERPVLDSVICSSVEVLSERTPTVAFAHGRWRLVAL